MLAKCTSPPLEQDVYLKPLVSSNHGPEEKFQKECSLAKTFRARRSESREILKVYHGSHLCIQWYHDPLTKSSPVSKCSMVT